jgi:hypothetical protein
MDLPGALGRGGSWQYAVSTDHLYSLIWTLADCTFRKSMGAHSLASRVSAHPSMPSLTSARIIFQRMLKKKVVRINVKACLV